MTNTTDRASDAPYSGDVATSADSHLADADGARDHRSAATAGLAFVLAGVMLGATMPTALYSTYQHNFGFSLLTVTVIFAMYAFGVLAALLAFGTWSDVLGRRPVLLMGLAFAALSDVVFLLADSTGWLLVGRVISGLSAGVFVGTASVAVTEMAGGRLSSRAPLIASVANIGGLGIGPVIAAMLVAWVPGPMRTSFWVHLGLVAVSTVVVLLVPETRGRRPGKLRPMPLGVPADMRVYFMRASLLGFAGFAVMGLFTGVAPSIATKITGVHSAIAVSFLVFSMFIGSVVGQLAARRVRQEVAERTSILLFVVAMVLLILTFVVGNPILLAITGLVGGVGQGMSFAKGLAVITTTAPAEQKAAVTSAFFVVCYIAISVPVIAEGLLAQYWQFKGAGIVFAVVIAVLALLAGALEVVESRKQRGTPIE